MRPAPPWVRWTANESSRRKSRPRSVRASLEEDAIMEQESVMELVMRDQWGHVLVVLIIACVLLAYPIIPTGKPSRTC
jgi:predicted alpha/beta-hydrolase family hydrolase